MPYLNASDDAKWYAELTDTENEGQEYKTISLTGHELAKQVTVTWKLEAMAVEAFIGFISGIISQDHDLEIMFLDSFLKLASLEGEDISQTISALEKIGEKYHVTFVLSISMDAEELPENARPHVIISL